MAKTAKKPETVFISEADQYLFAQGTHYDIYKKLGAHLSEENGKKGVTFAVWAPTPRAYTWWAALTAGMNRRIPWKSWAPAEFI